MKKVLFSLLFLFNFLLISAENATGDILPKNDWVIRINAGSAFAYSGESRESAWNNNIDKKGCGFQYGIDVLNYKKYIGYGITFKHYMHNLPIIKRDGASMDEDIRIFYIAPQFSYIDESGICKGLIVNMDFGIGYAHYLSDGIIDGSQSFSLPSSGLGLNINLGFEYRFYVHWGLKLSASGEYYHFKDMHNGDHLTDSFDQRTKLNLFLLTPQIGLAYHF